MNHNTKKSRLEQYVKKIAPADGLESMKREPSLRALTLTESLSRPMGAEPTFEAGQAGLEKLERGEDPTEHEMLSIEAIVLPRERPVVFIEDNSFSTPETPWEHFATDAEIRGRIEQAIPSIGRVELPNNLSIPFGGTAFVVGDDLLMTNRHVAELFASGLGMRNVMFRPGQTAGWDHMRERTSLPDNGTMLEVKGIVMIHPFWDMALLRVAGLNASHSPLRLSVTPPEELVDHDVAVIGYPAKDWRNDSELQDRIFGRVFNVKRLQPGKIKPRASIRSFENNVSAMTHDSSTLGGNSGSAIVDARTGDVVGLHFAGQYLLANYGVPTYELARDQRIVDLGVKFAGSVSPDSRLTDLWRRIEPRQENLIPSASTAKPAIRPPNSATTTASVRFDVGDVSFTIPVQVSVTSATQRGRESVDGGAGDFLEAMKEPIVARHLDKREGYDPAFLELDDDKVIPLPKLTATGEKIVARIDGETPELKYHKFSIVMHKKRRLALFTASNVDWRDELRRINGRKPTRKELTGLGDNDTEKWFTDERIAENQQLPDKFFTKDGTNFDKGHIVRRDDVCWGTSFKDIQKANGDTYHTTNCSPQISEFNQAAQGKDNWGDLENLVQHETDAERAIVFAGPVLSKHDQRFEGVDEKGEVLIQIPSKFWKIIVTKGDDGPQAFGFVLEQDLSQVPLEFAVPAPWRRFMRKIEDIEGMLFGLAKLDAIQPFDQFDKLRGRRVTSRMRR
jgi:endonuclease G